MHRWRAKQITLLLIVSALSLFYGECVNAGTFIFAGDANGVDVVTHPKGYFGSGGEITITVGIAPDTNPVFQTQMDIPVRNAISVWNEQQVTTGNLLLGNNNDIPSNALDYESTLIHEMGHCIGLAHPNLASESGVSEANQDYTKSAVGSDNVYNLATGADGVRGSHDDLRGDDVNLHWFNIGINNPFTKVTTVDSSSYSRNLADLPSSETYVTNGDRIVATLSKYNVPNTEAIMQQGTLLDEAQRTLAADDVATLQLGMSGLDMIAGDSDDYTIKLQYIGVDANADVLVHLEGSSFAFCQTNGAFISGGAGTHVRITSAEIYMGTPFNWYFNQTLTGGTSGNTPEITSPIPGTTLTSDTVTFEWTANGAAVTAWWLYVGTSQGGSNIYDSGALGTSASDTVSGLPTDGSTVYVRLWYLIGGEWLSADFEYTATSGIPSMWLINPNGGETIPSGSTYTIEWDGPAQAEKFKLQYSLKNGKDWKTIEKGIVGKSYDWQVPKLKKNTNKCLVRVTGYNTSNKKVGVDKSNAPFNIEVVKITAPNGGETLTSGNTYNIKWDTFETKKPIFKILLKYTKNGGKKWETIKTIKGNNPGTYLWTVPTVLVAKNNCKVVVQLKDKKGKSIGSDTSDSFFVIQP